MACKLAQMTLFLTARTTLQLKFRLQSRIISQHEYNSFSLLRFSLGEGAKKNTNKELFINLRISNSKYVLLLENIPHFYVKAITQKNIFPCTKYLL